MILDINEITRILPHRYPFLLVDRVLEMVPAEKIVALKNVTMNEPFFQGHFPGLPIMPGVLLIEAMAQAAAVLAVKSQKGEAGAYILLVGIDKAKFRKQVIPGDQLKIEVVVEKSRHPFWWLKGRCFVGDTLAVESSLSAMVTVQVKKEPTS